MNTGKVILGFAAGIAAGAVAGILLAPDKGTNTRKKIVKGGEDLRDGIKDRFYRVSDFITEKFDGSKHAANDLVRNAKSHVDEVKKEAKTSMS